MWFAIRHTPHIIDGAKHFFNRLQLVRLLSSDAKVKVSKYVKRNAYFAHPENLLLTMLADSDERVHMEAVEKVLTAKVAPKTSNVRRFAVLKNSLI